MENQITFLKKIYNAVCCLNKKGVDCDTAVHVKICEPLVGIENSTYEACYAPSGAPMRVEIIRNEDGTFNRYVGHLLDGTGQLDPLPATDITSCESPSCIPLNNSGLVTNINLFN